jgi:hypothetical protein
MKVHHDSINSIFDNVPPLEDEHDREFIVYCRKTGKVTMNEKTFVKSPHFEALLLLDSTIQEITISGYGCNQKTLELVTFSIE